MMLIVIIVGFLLSATASHFLTPWVRDVAERRNWVDTPDGDRKLHSSPMPRVGGLAIVGAFLVGLSFFAVVGLFSSEQIIPGDGLPSLYLIAGALIMAAVGFYDDIRGLHFGWKFAAQVGVAVLMVFGDIRVKEVFNLIDGEAVVLAPWLSAMITIVWIVGAINAINLLDGMDGLASGVAVIAFSSMTAAYVVLGSWTSLAWVAIIIGSLVGFLRYNFNPARIFMGDSGSMFVGFLIAAYSITGASRANSLLAFMIPIIAMGLPVIDTGLAIVRRFLERRPLFHPDGDHIHHRVAKKLGLSHKNTVLILYAISVGFGIAAFLLAVSDQAIGDNLLATFVLCATGISTFLLLKSLGYLRIPTRSSRVSKVRGDGSAQAPTLGDPPDAIAVSWQRDESGRQDSVTSRESQNL